MIATNYDSRVFGPLLAVLIALPQAGCGDASGPADGPSSATDAASTTSGTTTAPGPATADSGPDTTWTDPTTAAAETGTTTTTGAWTTDATDAATSTWNTSTTGESTTGESTTTGNESTTGTNASTTDESSSGGDTSTGAPASDDWLIRAAAGSSFDDARGVVIAPGGAVMLAGYAAGEPGETLWFGDDDDPGRIARVGNGKNAGFLSRHDLDGAIAWTELVTSDLTAHTFALTEVEGGVVVLGMFQGEARLGAGQANATKLVSRGSQDIYLARYDLAGALQWAVQIGGPSGELGHAVATLSDGSIAVVGYYADAAVFGAGATETTLISQDLDDAFVARYSPAGELLWVRDAGGGGNDEALAAAATADGGLVVTGSFHDDLVFDRGGPSELTFVSAGAKDVFSARFTASGERTWAVRAGGADEFPGFGDLGTGVAVLADGAVLVCGEYNGPDAVFGPGEPNETILGAADDWSSRKLFVARHSADTGQLEWVKTTATGTNGEAGWHICDQLLPRQDGGFWVLGTLHDSAIFGPGEAQQTELVSAGDFDVVLAAYTAAGELAWARRAGSSADDFAGGLAWQDGDLVLVGSVRGAATFEHFSDAVGGLVPVGLSDAFALRFTP